MSSVSSAADLPDLSEDYPVTAGQIETFQRDGHVLLRGVASSEEVSPYRAIIRELVQRLNQEKRPLKERDTYAKAFIQIGNLWEQDERIRRFSCARRFAKIAADLMGVEGVRMYHDQALYKEAGGGHTPWHQDQYYWPLDTSNTVTMWMPLVDVTAEMGTMIFASGSQRNGYMDALAISDESDAIFDQRVKDRGYSLTPAGDLAAGDATFHAGWTLHRAPGNASDRAREAMTIIWFADGARIIPPDHPHRQADLEAYFPDQKPGDIAGGRLAPLLYRRG